jgi:hypothetical protein
MGIIVRGGRSNPPPPPGKSPVGSAPPPPPKDWEKWWKLWDVLDRQNPSMSLTAKEVLTHTRTAKDQDDAADEAKKKARVAAIRAANRAKRRYGKDGVSGYGTVSPILSGYPSETVAEAGTGFSWSSIPTIVWIILAVGGGIYLIKSAGRRK